MSRVEVEFEGKNHVFSCGLYLLGQDSPHILGFHLTSRLDFRRSLVSGLPSPRRILHGCAMQVALSQRII